MTRFSTASVELRGSAVIPRMSGIGATLPSGGIPVNDRKSTELGRSRARPARPASESEQPSSVPEPGSDDRTLVIKAARSRLREDRRSSRETDARRGARSCLGCCGAGAGSARATISSFLPSYREADRLRSFNRAARDGTQRLQRRERLAKSGRRLTPHAISDARQRLSASMRKGQCRKVVVPGSARCAATK